MNKIISKQKFEKERSLYNLEDAILNDVSFEGKEDGESPLKEASNILLNSCSFSLRYPLWHNTNTKLVECKFNETSRAPFWYDDGIRMSSSILHGPKAFRECKNVEIENSDVISPEFMWRCANVKVENSSVVGEYAFFESRDVAIKGLTFGGKYSFQYINRLVIDKSKFDTKDAFWHIDNAVISDSTIKGEYLGWYSNNLTFVRCKIISHQPLCYCRNLKLVDCEMIDCDLAFEYSDVEATIIGHVDSIKNPMSGHISADSVGEIIRDDDKYPNTCIITIGNECKKA